MIDKVLLDRRDNNLYVIFNQCFARIKRTNFNKSKELVFVFSRGVHWHACTIVFLSLLIAASFFLSIVVTPRCKNLSCYIYPIKA
jgi:hypothetical protein